jgi:hypothetical protein
MDAPIRRTNLPPLSDSGPLKIRRSKSVSYTRASPEYFWKLTPILPQLWLRDGRLLTREAIDELEAAWLRYQTLSIRGKGDGGGVFSANTVKKRMKLKKEYEKLEPDVRRAKEVALARYKHFTICGPDGTLDYHIETLKKIEEVE